MTMLSARREVGEFRKRYKWMALAVVVVFGALIVRLIYLQIIEHEEWAAEAQRNITKRIALPATRGIIRDIKGRVIAQNRPSYDVYLTPQLLGDEDVAKLADLMQLDPAATEAFRARVAAVPARRRSQMVRLFSNVTRDQLAALETHHREFRGLSVITVPMRSYPYGSLGAHTVGFINELSAEDLERFPDRDYRSGQFIGRSGIERAWESYLRGRDGELSLIVDARGRQMKNERHMETRKEPVGGRDLTLTLDMDLMRVVQRAFRGHPSGAAVVVDVRTGRLRAMYSKPSYDLGEMSSGLSYARMAEIQQNPFRPLIDKTTYESYFPGSTFKPITALAGMQDHVIDATTRVDCPGFYELGKRKFRCTHVHGEVDLRSALVQSCNVFFYRLAELVGLDRLAAMARAFGLGARTGVGINTEASGFIPTRDWYVKQHGQYRLGFTLNSAIGQGNTRVTLVQLALVYAAIANGGTLYVPQLVQRVQTPGGEVIEEFEPRVRRTVSVDRAHLTYVIDGLFGVVNEQNGTAFAAHVEGAQPAAGKTGTAQVSRGDLPPGEDPRRAWYYRRSHAWFAGFAPAANPELAVVVILEHGGHGGKYAAPIATQILDEALGHAATTAQLPRTDAVVAERAR